MINFLQINVDGRRNAQHLLTVKASKHRADHYQRTLSKEEVLICDISGKTTVVAVSLRLGYRKLAPEIMQFNVGEPPILPGGHV